MGDAAGNKVITKLYAQGETVFSEGQSLNQIAVVMSGTLEGKYGSVNIYFQQGAVIGLFDSMNDCYIMEYTAAEDLEICFYEYTDFQDFRQLLVQEDEYAEFIMEGSIKALGQLIATYGMEKLLNNQIYKYVKKQYGRYLELCEKLECVAVRSEKLNRVTPVSFSLGELEETRQYYKELCGVSGTVLKGFFGGGETLAMRHLKEIPQLAQQLLKGCDMLMTGLKEQLGLLCGEDNDNIFVLYTAMLKNSLASGEVTRELLSSLKAIVELREKIELTVADKLHSQITKTGPKYRRLYENIAEVYKNNAESGIGNMADQLETIDSPDNVTGMLDKLLDYSQLDDEFTEEFREVLQQFCDMPDRLSTDNADRALRKKLTGLFYKLYRAVFFRTEKEQTDAKIFDLFLNFAIVDETMFRPETLEALANREKGRTDTPIRVYTIRQWLHEIYTGNKEPSRNEFDQDYQEYLREINKSRVDISPQEMEKLNSKEEKVKFEIKNFFSMNNRLTSGHLLTFCPVMTEEDLGDNFVNQLMTPEKINEAFQKILSIDFSVFHRDVLYDDPKNGISKLTIHQQVLPDVVLMPNAGTMGRMWQEISGRKRASAGRFTVPVVLKEDLLKITVRMIGNFRWEICKRVQGNYWNDVSEPSLTSEFCDYIQFYKKNRDLSDKAREKIAQMLTKCRNNYGEVFVNNYIVWVISESAGNVRLDKITRNIMGRYCPFVQPIRAKLMEQPMFTDAISRYERERVKRVKELNNRRAAIRNCNGTETEEFQQEMEYWQL